MCQYLLLLFLFILKMTLIIYYCYYEEPKYLTLKIFYIQTKKYIKFINLLEMYKTIKSTSQKL